MHNVDYDECRYGTSDCDVTAICTNLKGSYTCTCSDGFIGDGRLCYSIGIAESINNCFTQYSVANSSQILSAMMCLTVNKFASKTSTHFSLNVVVSMDMSWLLIKYPVRVKNSIFI